MTLKELMDQMDNIEPNESSLSIGQQIEKLKQSRKSVFTVHMDNGDKIVTGDFEYDQTEMRRFFELYPPDGCNRIEFHQ